CLLSKNSWTF
nr:immunoglobulin light chain junction region [Macaca mulatta]